MKSRFEPDEERNDRIALGVALCRSVLRDRGIGRGAQSPDDPHLTESQRIVAAARQRAATERRTRTFAGDPRPIADTVNRIRKALR